MEECDNLKILLLDGSVGKSCDEVLGKVMEYYSAGNHEICHFKLEDKKILFCVGCWTCWFRTPGICIHNDDTQLMLKEVINSDLVVHFTENSMGFVTSFTKKALDKFVPLVHPYIELVNGECHHEKRYEKYPEMGLIYVNGDREDFNITRRIFERTALNFKSQLKFAVSTDKKGEALNYENICI